MGNRNRRPRAAAAPHFVPVPTACPLCDAPVRLVRRGEVDEHARARVRDRYAYVCSRFGAGCDALAMVRAGGIEPIATMAGTETRRLRYELHQLFDRLWRDAKRRNQAHQTKPREVAYRWLARALGGDGKAHIGLLDAATCRRALTLVRARLTELGKIEEVA